MVFQHSFSCNIQMRGVSEFGAGDWSEAVVTQVSIPDPPQPSNVTEIEVEQYSAGSGSGGGATLAWWSSGPEDYPWLTLDV